MPLNISSKLKKKIPAQKIRQALEATLFSAKRTKAILEISLVGNHRIRTLKRTYLGKDQTTDVLSFPMDWTPPGYGGPWILGGIVISLPVAASQARRANRKLSDQLIRLAVHGFVHLSGRDHEKSRGEAGRFQREEKRVLSMLHRKGLMRWDGSLQF